MNTQANGNLIDINDVSLRYGVGKESTLALAGTDIQVSEGEFVSIVGPSGCGKSTIVKLVSGLIPVTSGRMNVDGQPVTGPLSIVGIAFQNPVMLPWMSTIDNVLLPLKVARPHRDQFRQRKEEYQDQARALLKVVGLDGFESRYPWELSGGMRQRASLCRALIHEPRLLLLDEPFASLDAFTREDLWGVLQDLWLEKKPTIIMITHDLREAVYLSDKVYVMSARPGRIIYERDINLERPRNIEMTFEDVFVEMAHDLRQYIQLGHDTSKGEKSS
jgi:NitT/TauT family transport system ATP-binding protein